MARVEQACTAEYCNNSKLTFRFLGAQWRDFGREVRRFGRFSEGTAVLREDGGWWEYYVT